MVADRAHTGNFDDAPRRLKSGPKSAAVHQLTQALDAGSKTAEDQRVMAWFYLILAGVTEVAWAVGLKQTDGWTRLWPSVITAILMVLSFVLLSLALRALPLGTAYAVWTGIGAVGTAIIGIVYFGEPRTAIRLGCIVLIVIGILGLKASSTQ